MKFLIDADLPYSLKEIFKKYKHDVLDVRDSHLTSATDEAIFSYAKRNRCIIVTRDLDFAEMFTKKKALGLILIRLPFHFTADKINKTVNEFLKAVDIKNLVNAITVIELGRFRIRKLD
jgi:predicted nuclease of predicted toxin-antitoxin system